jgi:hypothetical protein
MSKKYTYLSWIDNHALEQAIRSVYQKYKQALAETSLKHLQRNIIDPFLTTFEVSLRNDLNFDDWLKQEAQRQIQKTLSNAIGDFHQMILGSVEGWINLGINHETGLDLRNEHSTIWAEIKNKYNTIKGEDYKSIFQKLENTVNKHKNSTVYLVHILRKKKEPYDEIWSFTAKGKSYSNPQIKLISGEKFYEIVAGKNSLPQLSDKLPEVIENLITPGERLKIEDLKAYEELENILGQDFTSKEGFLYLFQQAYTNYDSEIESQ